MAYINRQFLSTYSFKAQLLLHIATDWRLKNSTLSPPPPEFIHMFCTVHGANARSRDQHESEGFYNRDGVRQCEEGSEALNMIPVYLNCISKTAICFVRPAAGLATSGQVSVLGY